MEDGVFMSAFSGMSETEAKVEETKIAVTKLLDREEAALEELGRVSAIANDIERLEATGYLYADIEGLVKHIKSVASIVSRAKKRMEEVVSKVKEGVLLEVESQGGQVETPNWKFKVTPNPVSLIVDDLDKVPKKYRSVPKPIPEWKKWPVDKSYAKQALVKEQVKSIEGVHLEQTERVDIKPR